MSGNLPGVGGIVELPEVDGTPLETDGSSGPNYGLLAGMIAVVVRAVALGGVGWYVGRRRLR